MLQAYLRKLEHPQISFSVKQRRPKTLDEVAAATLEMESYASTLPRPESTTVVQDADENDRKEGATTLL